MDITMDLSSFTLLELNTPFKYREHFEHHSQYVEPIQKRINRIKWRWKRIEKLLSRPETALYLHSMMRFLGQM
jgi:hypothetical protein